MRYLTLSFLSIYFFTISATASHAVAAQMRDVKIQAPRSEFDTSHQMNIALVELALQKTRNSHGPSHLTLIEEAVQYGDGMRLLTTGQIDVDITGTNIQREGQYQAIRIPLLKGMLGVRSLIIHRKNRDKFAAINNKQQLAELLACQKDSWPDSQILANNNLPVYKTRTYEALFDMVQNEKCDYFPRGIHEGKAEVAAYNKSHRSQLMLFDQLLLVYPFPLYFFVHKNNTALAEQLKQGITRAMSDGSYLSMLKQHPLTQDLFPLSQWRDTHKIYLNNHDLSSQTPLTQARYWWPEFYHQ